MIVCTKCGSQNEDTDTFCGSCAGFLEWSGEKQVVEAAPGPAPEPEPEPEAAPTGIIERVKDRMGIGDAKDDEAPVASGGLGGSAAAAAGPSTAAAVGSTAAAVDAGSPVTTATVGTAGPAETAVPTVPVPVASGLSTTATSAAAAAAGPGVAQPGVALTGVAQPGVVTAPVQPEAVKPTTVRARPTHRTNPAPSRVINPGDLVCGQCGEGNDPSRKFCRRCGTTLQQAEVFKLPWYQRWWRALTVRKPKAAGDRPHTRRRLIGGSGPGIVVTTIKSFLVVAITLLVVLAFVGPWTKPIKHRVSDYYHDALNVVHPTYNAVHPETANATSSAAGHPPAFAIDGASNTSWGSGAVRNGVGQSLQLLLATPSNIDKIGFLNGDQDTPQAILTEPRPESIHVTFVQRLTEKAANGTSVKQSVPYTKDFTLKDAPGFQTFTLKAKNVFHVTITIRSVYPAAAGHSASIAEVELFKKS